MIKLTNLEGYPLYVFVSINAITIFQTTNDMWEDIKRSMDYYMDDKPYILPEMMTHILIDGNSDWVPVRESISEVQKIINENV